MIYRVVIHGTLPGLNEYTDATRRNRYAGAALKKQVEGKIIAELLRQFASVQVKEPVLIRYRWFEKNRRRDLDNISFARKFINDALVKAGILTGDGWRNIAGQMDTFCVDARNPRIELDIEEL